MSLLQFTTSRFWVMGGITDVWGGGADKDIVEFKDGVWAKNPFQSKNKLHSGRAYFSAFTVPKDTCGKCKCKRRRGLWG